VACSRNDRHAHTGPEYCAHTGPKQCPDHRLTDAEPDQFSHRHAHPKSIAALGDSYALDQYTQPCADVDSYTLADCHAHTGPE
jgi:hypothetical protein